MRENCVIKSCRSNQPGEKSVVTFAFPTQDNRCKEWVKRIKEAGAGGETTIKATVSKICLKHFEEKFICRYEQAYDVNFQKKTGQKSKLCLSKDALPTLFLNSEDDSQMESTSEPSGVKTVKKRGSSGLANLQKARMKKTLKKERMQKLLQRTKHKNQDEKVQKVMKLESEDYDSASDYFLGSRQEAPAEKLVIPLRLSSMVSRLHDGSNLCKMPPASIKDSNSFPTFRTIREIALWVDVKKNPLEWTTNEASFFVKHISPIKSIAKSFRSEDIDGEALLNLTKFDLMNHFNIDPKVSMELMEVFTKLREEVIRRYINA